MRNVKGSKLFKALCVFVSLMHEFSEYTKAAQTLSSDKWSADTDGTK